MAPQVMERVIEARFPEVSGVRRDAASLLHKSSTDEFRERVLLVLSELCTNTIEAVADPAAHVTVHVRDVAECVMVEVEDLGPGFAAAMSRPGASPVTERGRGLQVVKALVDEFAVVRDGGRTIVRCTICR